MQNNMEIPMLIFQVDNADFSYSGKLYRIENYSLASDEDRSSGV